MLKYGFCTGPPCRYAHEVHELRAQPGLLKTKMCDFFLGGGCIVGEACRFAHSAAELHQAAELQRQLLNQPEEQLGHILFPP